MVETIKLADLDKGSWKVSEKDRPHIRKLKADQAQAGAMEGVVKAMAANIKILDKIAERMDIVSEPLGRKSETSLPPITVTVPVDKTKKKFRCTPVRNEDGLMLYVDIEQV
jgi:hypothetical protein